MKKTDIIRELRANRGDQTSYMIHFLSNFARAASLMHKTLKHLKSQEEMIEQANRGYLVSIVSCLETFYRDLYVHVLSLDESTLERVLPELKNKPTYSDIHSLLKEGVNFSEIAATEASFQSIAEIDSFMSKLFFPKSYLNELGSFTLSCVVPARSKRANMHLDKDWRSVFAEIFVLRHSFVHDANKPCDIALAKMQQLETFALLIPQLTTELLAQKLQITGMVRLQGVPVLLLVEDLISEDWEIADDGFGMQVIS